MAKKMMTRAKDTSPESVTLTYDLFDLPTAQHKAGLAGILLQIKSMVNRKKVAPTYELDKDAPTTKVHVTFTEETTKALFDDLYDAEYVKGAPREKQFTDKKTKKPKPALEIVKMTVTDKKNGKTKEVDGYVYLDLAPALPTLRHYLPKEGDWLRLWKDLIWQVIRDSKKKAPFIKRGLAKPLPEGAVVEEPKEEDEEGDDEEKGKGDGSTWTDIIKFTNAFKKNEFTLGKLSSALLLGAQSENAESIPFIGRIDQNLLLHFWPLTVMVYVPRFIDGDGTSHIGRRDKDDKSQHFCLAVPEVSNLKTFLVYHPQLLNNLGIEKAVHRPKESLVDVAAESGLAFIEHLARIIPQTASGGETESSIAGVEYMHVNKDGNIVRFLTTGRVAWDRHLAERYRSVAKAASNPLFRGMLMIALVENRAWYQPFGTQFALRKHEFFVPSETLPKSSWFWIDARKYLTNLDKENAEAMKTDPKTIPEEDKHALLIHRLIRTYLGERAKQKSGIDPEKFREGDKIAWDKLPPKYAEEKRGIGETLFLQFRSRRDQAFIDHFAATFFAVKQFLNEENYAEIARTLMDQPENVKTLTLMALSANS